MKNAVLVNGMPPIHPGEFLREILENLVLTQAAFARAIDVRPNCGSHIVKGNRPVTAVLALRLARALGQTPYYWLNLQATFDLKRAQVQLKDVLKSVQILMDTRHHGRNSN